MESARCTQNNALYGAQQFAELPVGDLEDKRRNLVCPECGRPAFFRKQTQNERNACFGARPHNDGCSMCATQGNTRTNDSLETYAGLLNSSKRIVIDFDHGSPAPRDNSSQSESAPSANEAGELTERSALNSGSVTHMRLRPLLRLLMGTLQFSSSHQIVEIEGMCRSKACDLFVPAAAVNERHERMFMGVFGKISSVHYLPDMGTIWLNFYGANELSICLPPELTPGLFHRLGIDRICAFAQANVLIFGFVRISQAGKRYMVMDNQVELAVDFARDQ